MRERRPLLGLLVAAGLLILVQQAFDVAGGAQLASSAGRYNTIRLLWTRLPALLAADTCCLLAVVLSHARRGAALFSVLHVLLAVCGLAGSWLFLRAAGEVSGSVPLDQLLAFRITVSRVLVVSTGATLGSLAVGRVLWRKYLNDS